MDLLDSLSELTRQVGQSRAALDRAVARGREIHDGTDDSGTVTILIDDDGTARDVRVAADWRARLPTSELGPAVVAADTEAATRRAGATATALAYVSIEDMDAGPPPHGWLAPVPAPSEGGRRRSLEELSAAVWSALDDMDRVTQAPPTVCGTGAEGAVKVTMAGGRITACEVNEAWLAHQDDVTLTHALREAVSAAACAGIAARTPLADFQRRLHEVVADARATLVQLRPAGTR